MSKFSQQAREGERGPQSSEDEGGARCDVLALRSREGPVCPHDLEEVAAPQAPGQEMQGLILARLSP